MDIWLPNRANFVYLAKLHEPLVNKMTRYPPHTAEADWDCRPSSEFRHLRHDCSPRCLTKMTRYLTTSPLIVHHDVWPRWPGTSPLYHWLFTTMFDQDDPVPHHFTHSLSLGFRQFPRPMTGFGGRAPSPVATLMVHHLCGLHCVLTDG